MLVLGRRKNESIMIGDSLEIVITDVRGDYVRIGIIAPRSIPVHRKEIYEAIRQEKMLSAADAHSFFDDAGDMNLVDKGKVFAAPY